MNELKRQILKLDATFLITPGLKKRVEAFKRIEAPATFMKRNIDRVVHSLSTADSEAYSDAVDFTLSSITSLEKFVAELKKRCEEFKRMPEVTLRSAQKH